MHVTPIHRVPGLELYDQIELEMIGELRQCEVKLRQVLEQMPRGTVAVLGNEGALLRPSDSALHFVRVIPVGRETQPHLERLPAAIMEYRELRDTLRAARQWLSMNPLRRPIIFAPAHAMAEIEAAPRMELSDRLPRRAGSSEFDSIADEQQNVNGHRRNDD